MPQSSEYRELLVERLRAILRSQGASVTALEKRLNRGRGYVADALRGEKRLSVEMILEVLDAVGVSADDFFQGRAPMVEIAVPPQRLPGAVASMLGQQGGASVLAQALLVLLADKGILSPEQLEAIQSETPQPSKRESRAADRRSPRRPVKRRR